MAKFNVNLTMSSGMDFYQEFSLTNADFTPLNITNATFHGTVKKHAGAVNALTTTSTDIEQSYVPLTTSVVDGLGGVVSVELSSIESNKLKEGKYVFSLVMRNNNRLQEMIGGLVFVERSFGIIFDQGNIIDGGTPDTQPSPNELIIDGGTPTTIGSGPDIDGGYVLGYI